jgi:dipeptidyl aminopeptidase/acylaminoacyl peptidase
VLPAIDKVIALGIGDSDRIFAWGRSFGGFAAFGIISQTDRFRAAIAWAGISDWRGYYGTFYDDLNYVDHPEDETHPFDFLETYQASLGAPPWVDPGSYELNSPISYVGKITTPLMIVTGDLDDIVPKAQSQQMFMSLYRQGKRAELVRYFGEGHAVHNPANIRDLWSRFFAWYDDIGDIARDSNGVMLFDGDRVRSRKGAPALKPDDYLKFSRMFDQNFGRAGATVSTASN